MSKPWQTAVLVVVVTVAVSAAISAYYGLLWLTAHGLEVLTGSAALGGIVAGIIDLYVTASCGRKSKPLMWSRRGRGQYRVD
jgi:hypothetical protein